jgi:hypothetical protein
LCPAVALSRHSAVALLLKAVLIQVSDYSLLGASGFSFLCILTLITIVLSITFTINCKKVVACKKKQGNFNFALKSREGDFS